MFKTLSILSMLAVLSSSNVHAEIDPKVAGPLATCVQTNLSFDQSGNMYIADALECKSMYNSYYFVEFAVANIAFKKEIFIVQSLGTKKMVRKKSQGYFIRSASEFMVSSHGATLYLGKGSGGHDLFLIKLLKPFGPSLSPVIDLYVKMENSQVSIENLVVTPK